MTIGLETLEKDRRMSISIHFRGICNIGYIADHRKSNAHQQKHRFSQSQIDSQERRGFYRKHLKYCIQ